MGLEFSQLLLSLSPTNPILITVGLGCCVAMVVASAGGQHKLSEDSESDIQLNKEVVATKRLPLGKLLHPWFLCKQFGSLFSNLPHKAIKNFITSFYIIKYRPEWGKYSQYDENVVDIKKKYKKKHTCHKFCHKLCRRKHKRIQAWNDVQPFRSIRRPTYAIVDEEDELDHNHKDCEQIKLNISGLRIVTQKRTLNRFPDTLLGNRNKRSKYYDPATGELFFDRNRKAFEAIMYYYQSGGILKKPYGLPYDIFLAELVYFQMNEALSKLKKVDVMAEDTPTNLPKNLLAKKIWLLFEYAESSTQAHLVSFISITIIGVSIVIFCAVTVRDFAYSNTDDIYKFEDRTKDKFEADDDEIYSDLKDTFFKLETCNIAWFTFELLMRCLSCPSYRDFFTNFMNLVDIVAISPYYLSLGLATPMQETDQRDASAGSLLQITSILKVARLVRVFKLSRHSFGLKVLGKTLRASVRELFLLILFLLIGVIFFSSAMYFAEDLEENTPFKSIPTGFWWAIITMTTVGYGDMVPVGIYGKIVGSCCSVAGVLTIALPVPVIVSNFNRFYKNHGKATAKKDEFIYVENCPNRCNPYDDAHTVKTPAKGHKVVRNRYCSISSESDSDFEKIKFQNKRQFTNIFVVNTQSFIPRN